MKIHRPDLAGCLESEIAGRNALRQITGLRKSNGDVAYFQLLQDFVIETPLMRLTKAQTWGLASGLGGDDLVEIVRADSHTCYLGERGELHAWGHGCGTCPACELRARGWAEWVAEGRPALAA